MFLIEKIMKMLKIKIKKNVITIIIENDIKNDIKNKNENINIKNIIRLLRTIIERLFA